jgi:hypothetical protein
MVIEFWPHLRSVETDLTSFIGMKKELGFDTKYVCIMSHYAKDNKA